MLTPAIVRHIMLVPQLTRETGRNMEISVALIGAFVFLAIGAVTLIEIIFSVGPF